MTETLLEIAQRLDKNMDKFEYIVRKDERERIIKIIEDEIKMWKVYYEETDDEAGRNVIAVLRDVILKLEATKKC